ncbi:MAG: YbhB/YbcL family Raf kinase inhibitor-like protein, partial [Candidatus Zixiibacteriota bacterium]
SPAFKEGEMIPLKFTCDSFDISPKIVISNVPENTKSLALICDDPDAPMGVWVHWVIFNLPPLVTELPEGISKEITPVIGSDSTVRAVQGINDFRRFGYGGPCPPKGSTHRYFFKLYALDTLLEFGNERIKKGITADDLSHKMEGHILVIAQLMGKYKR